MHRTKVKVAEDALDANTTIAHANRADFDRARVAVVNLMSAPGAGQDDAARARARRARRACAPACSRATCRARMDADRLARAARAGGPAQHRRRASAASATSTPTWSARRSPDLPLAEHRPAGDRERRQPRLPGRVPGRRGRQGDGLLGHRGRGQAAQVPADVPRLRARRRQQDRPAAAPRLRPRAAPRNIDAVNPDVATMLTSARTGEGVEELREWLLGVGRAAATAERARARRRRTPRPTDRGSCLRSASRTRRALLRRRGRADRARCCHRDGRALRRGGRLLVASGASPRRARTPATSRSSSSTR